MIVGALVSLFVAVEVSLFLIRGLSIGRAVVTVGVIACTRAFYDDRSRMGATFARRGRLARWCELVGSARSGSAFRLGAARTTWPRRRLPEALVASSSRWNARWRLSDVLARHVARAVEFGFDEHHAVAARGLHTDNELTMLELVPPVILNPGMPRRASAKPIPSTMSRASKQSWRV